MTEEKLKSRLQFFACVLMTMKKKRKFICFFITNFLFFVRAFQQVLLRYLMIGDNVYQCRVEIYKRSSWNIFMISVSIGMSPTMFLNSTLSMLCAWIVRRQGNNISSLPKRVAGCGVWHLMYSVSISWAWSW